MSGRTQKAKSFIILLLILIPLVPSVISSNSSQAGDLSIRVLGTIIVNASGSGDYTHIQWAVDNSSAGDTIFVEAGMYRENVIINKTLSLVGAGWENTTIVGQGNENVVFVTANGTNISGFKIRNSSFIGDGIHLKSVNSCRVENNWMEDNRNGLYLDNSDWNEIINNVCQDNDMRGIILFQSFYNSLQNNTCTENYEGILLSSSSNNIVNMNKCFSNQSAGIELSLSHNNVITNNSCSDNRFYGIEIYNSDNNSFRFNNIARNGRCGINLAYSVDSMLSGNLMVGGGIYFYGDLQEHWTTNDIDSSNLVDGRVIVFVKDSIDMEIPPNAGQIILAGCRNITVKDQNISGVYVGLQVVFSHSIIIEDNNFSNNGKDGIDLYNSMDVEIRHNRCDSNGESGIRMYRYSFDNEVIDNSCIGNYRYGIYIYNSYDNKIINNTCSSSNDYGIYVYYSFGTIISGNIANDNGQGIKIYWADGTVIRNNRCGSNFNYGISVDSQYCSLDNNICIGNRVGIYITDNKNNITNNRCMENQNGIQIYGFSTDNNLSNNKCSLNTESGLEIKGNSDGNLLMNNTFIENQYGIAIYQSSDENRLLNNSFVRNEEYGVKITDNSRDNVIVGNTFIENNNGSIQASDYCWGTQWDLNGSGNYWSDWMGPDENYDGIVDIGYAIYGSVKHMDHFPLVNPFGVLFPIAEAGPDIYVDQHEEVTFNSSACLNGPHIVEYTWNFTYDGEGYSLSGPAPKFTFHIPGVYGINLTVENILGEGSSDDLNVTVRDVTPPVADAGDDITVNQHEKVLLDAKGSSDNVAIVNISWSFIYNDIFFLLYGSSLDFVFGIAGEYRAILRVADAEGNLDLDDVLITVLDITPPVAFAGNDRRIHLHDSISLFGDRSTDDVGITNYTWRLLYNGTNVILYNQSIDLTFHHPGRYEINLTVSDAMGNADTDNVTITVVDGIPPRADAGKDVIIDPDNTVIFDGGESIDNTGIVSYNWKFEYDGMTIHLSGVKLFFYFEKSGRYFVMLLVTDEYGN